MNLKNLIGKEVKVFVEVPDEKEDVRMEWISGTVANEFAPSASIRRSTGSRPGVIVHAPGSAYKDSAVWIEDVDIDLSLRDAEFNPLT